MLSKVIREIKDYIFPVYCLGCNKDGLWLCDECQKKIPLPGIFCCPLCRQNNGAGDCCHGCQVNSHLDRVFALAPYQEDRLIGRVIEHFKYRYVEELSLSFARWIQAFVKNHSKLFADIEVIVPVPLHSRRLAERGFNQAELIAKILAKELNLPVAQILQRSRYTRQQAKLNKEERRENVNSAFTAVGSLPSKVLIVDDVFTTGSTMQECARALKSSGAKEVVGFTIARG